MAAPPLRSRDAPAPLASAVGVVGIGVALVGAGCATPPEPPAVPVEVVGVRAALDECTRGDLGAGLASLDATLAQTPAAPDALVARGLCRWRRWGETDDPDDARGAHRDLSDAIGAVERGAAAGTPLDRIYSHRAFVAQALDGAWDRAPADLDRAVEVAPGETGHVLDRGVARAYAGDTAAARRDLRRFLAADSADAGRQRVARALLEDLDPEPDR